ncbi:MAG: hypothetical protein AAGD13_17985 [Pseudomonadota bacterium]
MYVQTGFLASRLWLWIGIIISIAALAAYIAHNPPQGRDGSTIVGYGLGGLSALIVVYLSWLGVRKRRFASSTGRRRNVVSAHVFLGLTLIVTASLHTGFEFEWSVHTLSYVLLMIVILSGIWGITAYSGLPDKMGRNISEMVIEKKRHDMSELEQLEEDMDDLDRKLERSLQFLPDAFRAPIQLSLEKTKIGGGLFSILSGSSKRCGTAKAYDQVREMVDQGDWNEEQRKRVSELVADLSRKRELAACLRRDGRYRGLLTLWLWFHVPLTVALLVTLIIHVVLVFFYW